MNTFHVPCSIVTILKNVTEADEYTTFSVTFFENVTAADNCILTDILLRKRNSD